MKSCNPQTEPIRRCLLAGLFLSVAEYQREGHYLTVCYFVVIFLNLPTCSNMKLLFETAWIASNSDHPPIVRPFPHETLLHRFHRTHTDGQTLCTSSYAHRSGLDRRITQRDSSTAAPSITLLMKSWFSY